MNIYETAIYLVYFVPTFLIFFIIYTMKVAQNNIYKYIILSYFFTCLTVDILGHILGKIYSNNLILIPFFGVLELFFFSFLYFNITRYKIILYITIPTVFCFLIELFNSYFKDAVNFQTYTRFLSSFSIFILTTLYCYSMIKSRWKKYNSNLFLLNASLLIYSSFSSIYYLPINLLINWNSKAKFWFWIINIIVTLTFYYINTKVICNLGKEKKQ